MCRTTCKMSFMYFFRQEVVLSRWYIRSFGDIQEEIGECTQISSVFLGNSTIRNGCTRCRWRSIWHCEIEAKGGICVQWDCWESYRWKYMYTKEVRRSRANKQKMLILSRTWRIRNSLHNGSAFIDDYLKFVSFFQGIRIVIRGKEIVKTL